MRLDKTGHQECAGGVGESLRRNAFDAHDHAAIDRDQKGAAVKKRLAVEIRARQDAPDRHSSIHLLNLRAKGPEPPHISACSKFVDKSTIMV